MRNRTIILLFISLTFWGCRKDEDFSKEDTEPDKIEQSITKEEAETWFKQQRQLRQTYGTASGRQRGLSDLPSDSGHMESMVNHSGNYWLRHLPGRPKFQNTVQGYRKLAIFRDKDRQLHGRILEIIPDALYIQRKQKAETEDFCGRIFFYDENYRLLGGRILSDGKQIGEIKPVSGKDTSNRLKAATYTNTVYSCNWQQYGYFASDGVYTIYAERICSSSSFEVNDGSSGGGGIDTGSGNYAGHGGGGGGTKDDAPAVSDLPGESGPKVNSKELMNCFDNLPDAGSTMQVTVFVQEPMPGTTFNLGTNSVGHVAIGLTKFSGNNRITQVVGFYPDATGLDKMHAQSKIVDNSLIEYNRSITYTVKANTFNKIKSYISSPPATYDLLDFNCTNFVYEACQTGGITLPNPYNTVGPSGPGGATTAMTPAGLGDSISNLQGQKNVNNTGGNTPNSKGPCK